MNSAPRFLERPLVLQSKQIDITWRLRIPRISIRILLQLDGFTGTSLAANMAALRALLGATRKDSSASVTIAAHPLLDGLADQILAARARRHRQRRLRVAGVAQESRDIELAALAGADLGDLGLRDRGVLVGVTFAGWWRTWALLAAWVLAVHADLVGTKSCLAAVAGAAHSHADRLGDPGQLEVGGGFPFAGFQGKPVFGEEGAGLFLLKRTVVGEQGGLGANRFAGWSSSCRSTIFGDLC